MTTPPAPTHDSPAWEYRGHLDGLRTIAVYAVLVYHARAQAFAGGFIGVDLFFTLSGFLVTGVLLAELDQHGRIRLARFYARRVRRLLPAAAVMVVGTSLAALLIIPAADRGQLADDATASSLWFANWHFIAEFNDYFAVDSAESPFIHFWSLAIEEQFYLAFPIVMLAALRLGGMRVLAGIVMLLLTASLTLQVVLAATDVNRAYLGTDTRVYQILAGALLSLALHRLEVRLAGRRSAYALVVSLVAIAAFLVAMTSLLDVSASTRGMIAAALSVTLIGSLELGGRTPLTRALAARPMRYLGQISYGTYLWHWPVLVLARTLVDMSAIAATVVAAAVGTGLAALSSELVEHPIRRNQLLDRVPRPTIASGVLLAAVTGLAVAPTMLESSRRPSIEAHSLQAEPIADAASGPVPDLDWDALAHDQADVPTCELADGSDCFVTPPGAGTLLLVGDSHARMLIPALQTIAAERGLGLAVSFSPSCPWQRSLLAGAEDDRFSDRCRAARERTFTELIPALDPDVIVAAGFPRSTVVGLGAHTDRTDWQPLPLEQLVATATQESVQTFMDFGIPVLIIEPMPVLPQDQLSCLSAASDISECAMLPNPPGIEEAVERRLAAEHEDVYVLDLDPVICPALPVCDAVIDGVVVRRDAHHLTSSFATGLAPVLGAALDEALDG